MSESNAKPRIIVDTNLIVSGTIVKRGNPSALLEPWQAKAFTVLFSDDQHIELVNVLCRGNYDLAMDVSRLCAAP